MSLGLGLNLSVLLDDWMGSVLCSHIFESDGEMKMSFLPIRMLHGSITGVSGPPRYAPLVRRCHNVVVAVRVFVSQTLRCRLR